MPRKPSNIAISGGGGENHRTLAAGQVSRALAGLTQRQRMLVNTLLPPVAHNRASEREGWSIYRQPTTINPPTTLRLHKRDKRGKLVEVISITENGVTK